MEKDILSAAVAANEAELPVGLDINKGVLDTATEVMTDEQLKDLSDLNAARTRAAVDANSLTPEQIQTMMAPRRVIQQVRKHKKVGRNEPCPCGSGKKYKHCCLSEGTYEGYKNVNEDVA